MARTDVGGVGLGLFCFSVHYAARYLICHDGFDHLDLGGSQDDQLASGDADRPSG